MIKQFRTFHPFNIPLLILGALFLRFVLWDESLAPADLSFHQLYQHLLLDHPPSLQLGGGTHFMLSVSILIVQAFWFNTIVNTHNLIGKASFLPALLFIICANLIDSFVYFGPVQVLNFFVIWLLNQFFKMYRVQEIRPLIYNAGMIVASGAIIYTPFILMLPLIWISLLIFRPFNWREWMLGPLGFLTVFFFLGFYYYWNDALVVIQSAWIHPINLAPIKTFNFWILLPLGIVSILSFIQLRMNFFKSVVHIRKSYQLLFMFFLMALLSASPNLGASSNHYLLAAAPLAVLFSYYFMHADKRWIYEGVFFLLLASIFIFEFFPGFNFF